MLIYEVISQREFWSAQTSSWTWPENLRSECCIQHKVNHKVWGTCLQNQTGANLNLPQMARLIPLIRPTTCSCSSLLEVLAMASQQIRLHSPWNYTLLILSEADSADAQLPQCLEEYQLSPAQSESKDRMCACYPEETFLKILQDSESFLSYFPYAAAWASYPTPSLCKLGATDSFSHLLLTRQLCHFLLDKAHTAHSFRFFWGWFPARLSLSDQQKEMPRLCSQWKIRQHIS